MKYCYATPVLIALACFSFIEHRHLSFQSLSTGGNAFKATEVSNMTSRKLDLMSQMQQKEESRKEDVSPKPLVMLTVGILAMVLTTQQNSCIQSAKHSKYSLYFATAFIFAHLVLNGARACSVTQAGDPTLINVSNVFATPTTVVLESSFVVSNCAELTYHLSAQRVSADSTWSSEYTGSGGIFDLEGSDDGSCEISMTPTLSNVNLLIPPDNRSIDQFYFMIKIEEAIQTSTCEDTNNGEVSQYGDGCDYFEGNPAHCGLDNTPVFNSEIMCCACGGGETEEIPTGCQENNNGATNIYGYGCDAYVNSPHECGNLLLDDDDFTATEMCCQCGGGVPISHTMTAGPLFIHNPCHHQIYYNSIDQEMLENETQLFKIFYSSRLDSYIPTFHQLPIITHNAMITSGTCPTLELVASDETDLNSCTDTDNGAFDIDGYDCSGYGGAAFAIWNDSDFNAYTMCCVYNGGTSFRVQTNLDDSTPTLSPSTGQSVTVNHDQVLFATQTYSRTFRLHSAGTPLNHYITIDFEMIASCSEEMSVGIQGEHEATLIDQFEQQDVVELQVFTDPWTWAYQTEFPIVTHDDSNTKLCGDYSYELQTIVYGNDDYASYCVIVSSSQLAFKNEIDNCFLDGSSVSATISTNDGMTVDSQYQVRFKVDGCNSSQLNQFSWLKIVLDVTIASSGHQAYASHLVIRKTESVVVTDATLPALYSEDVEISVTENYTAATLVLEFDQQNYASLLLNNPRLTGVVHPLFFYDSGEQVSELIWNPTLHIITVTPQPPVGSYTFDLTFNLIIDILVPGNGATIQTPYYSFTEHTAATRTYTVNIEVASIFDTCSDTDATRTDSSNNGCNWYISNENECGDYDSALFSSGLLCCVCGGGWTSDICPSHPIYYDGQEMEVLETVSQKVIYSSRYEAYYPPITLPIITYEHEASSCDGIKAVQDIVYTPEEACVDQQYSSNSNGARCNDYIYLTDCGLFNNDKFNATTMCCFCGGGSHYRLTTNLNSATTFQWEDGQQVIIDTDQIVYGTFSIRYEICDGDTPLGIQIQIDIEIVSDCRIAPPYMGYVYGRTFPIVSLVDSVELQTIHTVDVQTDPWTLDYQNHISNDENYLCGDQEFKFRQIDYGDKSTGELQTATDAFEDELLACSLFGSSVMSTQSEITFKQQDCNQDYYDSWAYLKFQLRIKPIDEHYYQTASFIVHKPNLISDLDVTLPALREDIETISISQTGDTWETATTCQDSNNGFTNTNGSGCAWYYTFPSNCGNLLMDNDNFSSSLMCCVCLGGITNYDQQMQQTSMLLNPRLAVRIGDLVQTTSSWQSSTHLTWDEVNFKVIGQPITDVGEFTFSIFFDLVIDYAIEQDGSTYEIPLYSIGQQVIATRTYDVNVSVESDCSMLSDGVLYYGSPDNQMNDIEVIDVDLFMNSRLGSFTPTTFEIPPITSCPRMTLDTDDVEPTPWQSIGRHQSHHNWESNTSLVITTLQENMVVGNTYTRTWFLKLDGVSLGKSIQFNILYAIDCDYDDFDQSYDLEDIYLRNTASLQSVTTFNIGVDPWTQNYRTITGDSSFNLLCGTYTYDIDIIGFGLETSGVYEAQNPDNTPMLTVMKDCALAESAVTQTNVDTEDLLIDEQYTVKFTVDSCDLASYDWSYLKVQIKIRLESSSAEWKKVNMNIIKPIDLDATDNELEYLPFITGLESVTHQTNELMDPFTTDQYNQSMLESDLFVNQQVQIVDQPNSIAGHQFALYRMVDGSWSLFSIDQCIWGFSSKSVTVNTFDVGSSGQYKFTFTFNLVIDNPVAQDDSTQEQPHYVFIPRTIASRTYTVIIDVLACELTQFTLLPAGVPTLYEINSTIEVDFTSGLAQEPACEYAVDSYEIQIEEVETYSYCSSGDPTYIDFLAIAAEKGFTTSPGQDICILARERYSDSAMSASDDNFPFWLMHITESEFQGCGLRSGFYATEDNLSVVDNYDFYTSYSCSVGQVDSTLVGKFLLTSGSVGTWFITFKTNSNWPVTCPQTNVDTPQWVFTVIESCAGPDLNPSVSSTDIGMTLPNNGLLSIDANDSTLKDKAYTVKVTANLNNDPQSSAEFQFTIGYSMSTRYELEAFCEETVTNELDVDNQEYTAGNEILEVVLPPYQIKAQLHQEFCPFTISQQVTATGTYELEWFPYTESQITVETPSTADAFTITIQNDVIIDVNNPPVFIGQTFSRLFTFEINVLQDECYWLAYGAADNPIQQETSVTLELLYSSRESAYIPAMTHLEAITNQGVNCHNMTPQLDSASSSDIFTTNLDDPTIPFDWVSGQAIIHTIGSTELTLNESYSRTYDLIYIIPDVGVVKLGNCITITLIVIASCDQTIEDVIIEVTEVEVQLVATADSQIIDQFNIQIDPWTDLFEQQYPNLESSILCNSYTYTKTVLATGNAVDGGIEVTSADVSNLFDVHWFAQSGVSQSQSSSTGTQIDQMYDVVLEHESIPEIDLYNWTWMKVVIEVKIETSTEPITWAERHLIITKPSQTADIDVVLPLINNDNSYFIEELYGNYETNSYDQEAVLSPLIIYTLEQALEMKFSGSNGYEPCCTGQISWFTSSKTVIIAEFPNGSIGNYIIDIVFDLKPLVAIRQTASTWDNPSYLLHEDISMSRIYQLFVEVKACALSYIEMQEPEYLPAIYILSNTEIITFSEFSQYRGCGYSIQSFALEVVEEYSPEELGMSIDDEGQLTIETEDSNLRDKSYSVKVIATLEDEAQTKDSITFVINYQMSEEWLLADYCFHAIQNENDIEDQVYYSGGLIPLLVLLPPSSQQTPQIQDCSYSRIITQSNTIGEISSGLSISETEITLATEYSVPSAELEIEVSITMGSEFPEFNIERDYNFKIILHGEDFVDEFYVNETASISNSTLTTVTEDQSNSTNPQPGDSDFVFDWDYEANVRDIDDSQQAKPLNVDYYSITPTGLLFIEFNKPFITPQIRIDGRELAGPRQYDISDVLEFSLSSTTLDSDELEELLVVGYNLTEITENSMSIQIIFKDPHLISQTREELDTLTIRFVLGQIFVDSTDFQRLDSDLQISFPLIPQYSQEDYEETTALAESACQGAKTFSWATFMICLCLGYGLKYLWGTINVLQFLIFMIMWLIKIPQNALIFLKALKMLALMEFLNDATSWALDATGIQIKEEISGCAGAEDSLYKKKTIWDEGGTFFIFGICALIFIICFLLLFKCNKLLTSSYRVYRFAMTVKQKIFWNLFIRYIYTSCLKLQFFALTVLTAFEGYKANVYEEYAAYVGVIQIHVVYIRFFTWVREGRQKDKLFLYTTRMRYGSLYLDLRTDKPYVEWHSLVFFIRRSLFIAITFGFMQFPGIQVMCLIQLLVIVMDLVRINKEVIQVYSYESHMEVVVLFIVFVVIWLVFVAALINCHLPLHRVPLVLTCQLPLCCASYLLRQHFYLALPVCLHPGDLPVIFLVFFRG